MGIVGSLSHRGEQGVVRSTYSCVVDSEALGACLSQLKRLSYVGTHKKHAKVHLTKTALP